MKALSGLVLVVIGLVVFYLSLTGKIARVGLAWDELKGVKTDGR